MPKHKDLTGQRFGRLVVVRRAENDAHQNTRWLCRCECGMERVVLGKNLRNGSTRSCGCLHDEKARERMTKLCTTHGHSDSPLYRVRNAMIERCYRPSCRGFPRYGGRGITVCDEWRRSFAAFYEWAMSHGYAPGLQIDRIDNDGPYTPENCRFVTPRDNVLNSSICVRVRVADTFTGEEVETQTAVEASRITGVDIRTICRMLRGVTTRETRYRFHRVDI